MALEDWRPTVEQISAHLRARTVDEGGNVVTAFTEETRPTRLQVESMIEDAVEDVRGRFTSGNIPEGAYSAAYRAAALRAAYYVELSYFPEQAVENSPFLQLRALAEVAMSALIAHAQMRDLFAETSA